MARELRTRVLVHVICDEYETDVGVGSERTHLRHEVKYEKEFTSGTTDGLKLDRAWSTDADNTTTPADIDLVGTANLPSKLNGSNNVNFTDLCLVCVESKAASGGGNIEIGGSAAPVLGLVKAAGDVVQVGPEGILLWVAPHGVATTATTADLLRLVASAGTIPTRGIIAGRST